MSPFRVVLGFALALLAVLSFLNLVMWHSAAWFPIGVYAAIFAAAVIFEVGRYRPNVRAGGVWKRTGERFYDPTTGTPTEVFYDPQSGARDYRPR